MEQKQRFFCTKRILSEYQNTNKNRKYVLFLQVVVVTVDDAMVINIPPGLPGIRNMGLANFWPVFDGQVTPFSPTYALGENGAK